MADDETQRAIGRIEGQLAANTLVLQDIRNDLIRRFEESRQEFSAFEVRIAGVEKKVWWFSGIGACIAFIMAKFTGKL